MPTVTKKTTLEVVKFIARLAILIFGPQLLALATDNSGETWADLLSVTLPIVDKWIHESEKTKLNGLLPF